MSATTALVGRAVGRGEATEAMAWVRRVKRVGLHTGVGFGVLFALQRPRLGLLYGNAGADVQRTAALGIVINARSRWSRCATWCSAPGCCPAANDVRGVIMGDVAGAFVVGPAARGAARPAHAAGRGGRVPRPGGRGGRQAGDLHAGARAGSTGTGWPPPPRRPPLPAPALRAGTSGTGGTGLGHWHGDGEGRHGRGTLSTVGHGTLGRPELGALLQAHGIGQLVDVRRFPGSRRHPDLSRDALAGWLPGLGIGYRWEERLGGRRRLPAGEPVRRHLVDRACLRRVRRTHPQRGVPLGDGPARGRGRLRCGRRPVQRDGVVALPPASGRRRRDPRAGAAGPAPDAGSPAGRRTDPRPERGCATTGWSSGTQRHRDDPATAVRVASGGGACRGRDRPGAQPGEVVPVR